MNKELPNKLIISGRWVETFSYERALSRNSVSSRKSYIRRTYRDDSIINRTTYLLRNKNSLRRSRSTIMRIANSNPDLITSITLTFRDNATNPKNANYEFNKFIQRLRYSNNGNLKYLAVPELQKRGSIHYHLLSNLSRIDQSRLTSIWPHGFVKIKNIYNINDAGLYISKHLKENSNNSYLFGRRSYFTSRNIKRPSIYTSFIQNSSDLSEAWEDLKLYDLPPTYQKTYDSKYQGKVLYKRYKLKTRKFPKSPPD